MVIVLRWEVPCRSLSRQLRRHLQRGGSEEGGHLQGSLLLHHPPRLGQQRYMYTKMLNMQVYYNYTGVRSGSLMMKFSSTMTLYQILSANNRKY